ncbi:Major Facilitator Superfamily protein [compost metagenome]
MSNVALFYVYRIVSRCYFHLPILFIFFYRQDLSLPVIELMLAAYGLVVMLTAKWNVKAMRRMAQPKVIALGECLKGLGLVLLITAPHPAVLLAGQIVCGLGYSLAAGTDSSLLRSLFEEGDQEKYRRTESSSASFMFLSVLLAGIVGSVLMESGMRIPFYLSIAANAVSAAVILGIREAGPSGSRTAPRAEAAQAVKPETGGAAARPALELTSGQRFWRRYYSLVRAFTLAPFVGFIPFLLNRTLNIGMLQFGLVLSLFTLLGFVSARYAVRVGAAIGENKLVILTTVLSLSSMLLLALSPHIASAALAVAVMGLASGGARPLAVGQLSGPGMKPAERTAVLSSMERMYGFWNAFLLVAGGFALDEFGFRVLMLGLAAGFLLVSAVSYVMRRTGSSAPHSVSGELPS